MKKGRTIPRATLGRGESVRQGTTAWGFPHVSSLMSQQPVGGADSWVPPQTCWVRCRMGSSNLGFNKLSWRLWILPSLGTTVLYISWIPNSISLSWCRIKDPTVTGYPHPNETLRELRAAFRVPKCLPQSKFWPLAPLISLLELRLVSSPTPMTLCKSVACLCFNLRIYS